MIRLTASLLALLILSGCTEAVAPETSNSGDKEAENQPRKPPTENNTRQSLPSDVNNPWTGGGGSSSSDDNL